jgi:hypothetical protein
MTIVLNLVDLNLVLEYTAVDLLVERPSRALQLHVTNLCTSVPYIQALYAVCMLNCVSLYANLY